MEDLLAPELFNSRGKVKTREEQEICPTSWSESSLDSSFEESVPQLFQAVKKGMSPSLAARLSMPTLRTGKQLTQHLVYIINHGLTNNQVEVSLNLSVQFKAHPKFVSSLLYALSMVTKSPSRHLAQLLVSFLQTPDLEEVGGGRLESQVTDILVSWLGFSGDPGVGPGLIKDCRWLVEETGNRLLQEASSGFQMVFHQVKSSLICGVGGASVRAELVELLLVMGRQQNKLGEVKYGVDVVEVEDVKNTDKAESSMSQFINEYKETEETYQEFVDSKESVNEFKETKVNFEEDKNLEIPSWLSQAPGVKDECTASENVGEGNLVLAAVDCKFNETEEIELDNYESFAVPDEEIVDDLIPMKNLMVKEIEAEKGGLRLHAKESCSAEINFDPSKSCQKELLEAEPEDLRTEPNKVDPAVAGPRILGRLVSKKSQGEKMSFAVEENWLLGRSRDCQVYIPRKEVSKVHAAIRVVEGQIFIEANSDTNPLKVNKEVVAKGGRKVLLDGDLVKIGKEELEWIVQGDEQDQNIESSPKDELMLKYPPQDHSVLFHSVLEDSGSP